MKVLNFIKLDQIKYLIQIGLDLDLYDVAYENTILLLEKKEQVDNYLNKEERMLFMKAFKEKFNMYRDGWKNLLDFEQNEAESNFIPKEKISKEIERLEGEIKKFCLEMIKRTEKLNSNVIDDDFEAKIFFTKIKSDYLRYLAEIANEEEFPSILKDAKASYELAYKLCKDYSSPQDPLTLSVILNYTVFLYFILDDTKLAFGIADKAYKSATENIHLNEDEKKDPEVDVLIKRIEENLTIWKIELFDIS